MNTPEQRKALFENLDLAQRRLDTFCDELRSVLAAQKQYEEEPLAGKALHYQNHAPLTWNAEHLTRLASLLGVSAKKIEEQIKALVKD